MAVKIIITGFVLAGMLLTPLFSVSAQNRDDLTNQLNQAKKEYYEKKQDIDNAVSELGRQWHMYQLQMHEKIKEDPTRAPAVRSELWEGAKKLSRDKRALYEQLAPLRKQWYQNRLKLEVRITELEDEGAQR